MMKNSIGINQRIPVHIMEMALLSVLHEEATTEYFRELASLEYKGQNRIGKTVSVISHLTVNNPLLSYLRENVLMVEQMLRNKSDRPLLFTSIICSAYGFGYDVVSLLGKYFHVQDTVTANLICQKMAAKYGSNRSLPNALYSILPMLIEAGLLERPELGVYKAKYISKATDEVIAIYKQSFLLNNPTYSDGDDYLSNPYFEFINI